MSLLKRLLGCAAVVCGMLFGGMVQAATTITYYHNDLLGSPVAATDASAHVIWRESYRPYGERLTNDPASTGNDVWYTSRRQDADTGLVYMGARYYDPVVGRFVSKDPVGFDPGNIQSFNRYAYANDNPYRFVDPSGRSSAAVLEATAGVLVAGAIYTQLSPDQQRAVLGAVGTLGKYTIFGNLVSVGNLMLSEGAKSSEPASGESKTPELPDKLVGVEDDKSGRQGNRVNNGPLDPTHGGTGDPEQDFDTLTGGDHGPAPGDSAYPPGTRIGSNGIALRPPRGDSGARIDIPANGTKPHETLHYP
jgi:RHS repeat-associated protein